MIASIYILIAALHAGLSWKNPRFGLMLLVATLPSYLLRFELFGIPSTLLELLVLGFLIVWLTKNRKQIKELFKLPELLKLSIILFLLAGIIGVAVAPDTFSAIGIFKAYLLEPILLFLIVRLEILNKRVSANDLFRTLGVSAIILSLVAFVQALTGLGIPAPWDVERRVTSVFDYPNALGLYLGPIIIISLLKLKDKNNWVIWIPAAVLSIRALMLCESEAAIVSVVATMLLVGLIHCRTRLFTIALSVLLLIIVVLSPTLQSKLTLQDYSGGVRLSQWEETSSMLSDNWMLGAGLNGYPTALEPYHNATHYEIFQYPHNFVLNIWTELGTLGLIALLVLALAILKSKPSTAVQNPSAIAFFALAQMTIHGLVDVPYFKNDLAILTWVLIAVLYANARQKTRSK